MTAALPAVRLWTEQVFALLSTRPIPHARPPKHNPITAIASDALISVSSSQQAARLTNGEGD
jgi:hypothetical protein